MSTYANIHFTTASDLSAKLHESQLEPGQTHLRIGTGIEFNVTITGTRADLESLLVKALDLVRPGAYGCPPYGAEPDLDAAPEDRWADPSTNCEHCGRQIILVHTDAYGNSSDSYTPRIAVGWADDTTLPFYCPGSGLTVKARTGVSTEVHRPAAPEVE